MGEQAYRPRNLELGEMIRVLVAEHTEMRAGIEESRKAYARGDFEGVSSALRRLEPMFRQHIADEESQVLKVLIGALGRQGADQEIKVFQQHRPIHRALQLISELAAVSSEELPAEQEKLRALFDSHVLAEEERVFPRAVSVSGKGDR